MATLTPEEIGTFLSEPQVGHLVTVRPKGTPHVAPVWFVWDVDRVLVIAGDEAVKVRNIRRNPAVALSVAAPGRPYSYAVVEGTAEVTTDDLGPIVRRICLHYDGPERGEEFARELLDQGRMVSIRIRVDRVISWKDDDG